MGRKRKPLRVFENVEILNIGSEGKSVAKVDSLVLFVAGTVPGDIVDAKEVKKKKSFIEAYPMKFHKYSEDRVEPFCEHFGLCGGCKWQMLPYEKQLDYKQQQVMDQLTRIGKVELPEPMRILGSAETTNYRNKMDYTFSDSRWLTMEELQESEGKELDRKACGFHLPGHWNRIIDIDHCHLMEGSSNKIRNQLLDYARENNLSSYSYKDHTGFLRGLIMRTSITGDLMVIVQVGYKDMGPINGVMEFLKENFPEITSLNYVINTKQNDTFGDLEVVNYHGEPFITEEMEGLKFRVGPKSFYQTNSKQAYELYKVTREFAQLTGEEKVYDLYTGTGTIAQFVSKEAKEVIGIEYVESAIEDAKENASYNGIENCKFYAGDMKDILTPTFVKEHGEADVIITDPPRAGMHPDVVKQILKVAPKRVVYVSCNPATQARDIALMDEDYKVTKIRPVDMFPHTQHVENVVLLERR
ncbi:23S rRNA (uracil(1939)-C(5))-methyltransferase RlmD [Algivirga pacifica]|uniref:23S rRNA (Uracil(1939)-C(5))-methyltransferase RlmD n=1 Tax=Algivirga pacifica TaxID=1162670 RepID=A0ABP9DFS2_9BACT